MDPTTKPQSLTASEANSASDVREAPSVTERKRNSLHDVVEQVNKPAKGVSRKMMKRLSAVKIKAVERIQKRERQRGVRAEVLDDTRKEVTTVYKPDESRAAINKALRTSALFYNMEEKQINAIIDSMERTVLTKDAYVCKIGEAAKHFYAIEMGI